MAAGSGSGLAVGGPWGLSLRAVFNKKKSGFLWIALCCLAGHFSGFILLQKRHQVMWTVIDKEDQHVFEHRPVVARVWLGFLADSQFGDSHPLTTETNN